MKNINITVANDSPFYLGMKVYVIGRDRRNYDRVFRDKCPVCGDTKEIEYKGYTFKCPMCQSGIRTGYDATTILLHNYTVVEYITSTVQIEGSNFKTDYKVNSTKLPRAKWLGFTRWGNSYYDVDTRVFSETNFMVTDVEKIDMRKKATDYCFYSKAEALRFCKRLHERQKELLDQFNAEHGTDHPYPFKF